MAEADNPLAAWSDPVHGGSRLSSSGVHWRIISDRENDMTRGVETHPRSMLSEDRRAENGVQPRSLLRPAFP